MSVPIIVSMYDRNSPFSQTADRGLSQQDFAYQRLRSAIVECELQPGEEVSEARIVSRFGIAKAAARAALIQLKVTGLMMASPRRAWRVAPVTIALVRAVIDARRRLEPALAEVIPTDEELQMLRALASTAAAAGEDPLGLPAARATDRQLLGRLAELTGNSLLERWLAEAWDHSQRIERLCRRKPHIDREPLINAIAARRETVAVRELERALDRFETAAIELVMRTDAEIPANPRDARRHNRPDLPSEKSEKGHFKTGGNRQ